MRGQDCTDTQEKADRSRSAKQKDVPKAITKERQAPAGAPRSPTQKTSAAIARRLGVSQATVERAAELKRKAPELAYEQLVERVVASVRPGFARGEYRGWLDEDDDAAAPPLYRLEEACAQVLADEREAFIVLMSSPFAGYGWLSYEVDRELRDQAGAAPNARGLCAAWTRRVLAEEAKGKAGIALARVALLQARQEGWYAPARGEEPSDAQLRREMGAPVGGCW